MKKIDYEMFQKRYDKFKKNNLPTPYLDEERLTLEYVCFCKQRTSTSNERVLDISSNLTDSLGRMTSAEFNYSFTCKCYYFYNEGNKRVMKIKVKHNHTHSFETVIKFLYKFPESFKVSKNDAKFYSEQQLSYLRRIQKYLLFIGMKDVDGLKISNKRYQNKIRKKYENVTIYSFKNKIIKNIIDDKVNFRVFKWYKGYKPTTFIEKEYQALLTDENDNFKLFVEFTHEELAHYKNIKKLYKISNLKDNDKVILCFFKVLEKF